MYGINLNPILPVRTEAREQSEMCTQLLFGEIFSIIETTERWNLICNSNDNYKGWVNKKMVTEISESEFNSLSASSSQKIVAPIAPCFIVNKNEPITLVVGSSIYSYNKEKKQFNLNGNTYSIPADCLTKPEAQPFNEAIISTAKSFLNAPYLWGGKSVLGIDCSGLVQVCFSIYGIQLPRDANQQAEKGMLINLQDAKSGDLAFFENAVGKITHVGILIDHSTIIHASGKVKIEKIDATGIISQDNGKHTHQLRLVKRILK
jgi:hypothetical protein